MKKQTARRGGKGGRGGKKMKMKRKEIAAVESFRVNVQFAIQRLMIEHHVSQSALAEKLGMSQPRVSQFFAPSCNITIRNLARIFYALDDKCFVWSPGLEQLAAEGKVPPSPVHPPEVRLRVCSYEYDASAATSPTRYVGDLLNEFDLVSAISPRAHVAPVTQIPNFEVAPRSASMSMAPPAPCVS
jgi:transcriptional regulator with XRE-family HTH domain